jgi:hypothetical protein
MNEKINMDSTLTGSMNFGDKYVHGQFMSMTFPHSKELYHRHAILPCFIFAISRSSVGGKKMFIQVFPTLHWYTTYYETDMLFLCYLNHSKMLNGTYGYYEFITQNSNIFWLHVSTSDTIYHF